MQELDANHSIGEAEAGLTTLIELIESLSATRTIEEVADVVRSAARRILNADGVAFVMRDKDQCWYVNEDAIGPLWKGKRQTVSWLFAGGIAALTWYLVGGYWSIFTGAIAGAFAGAYLDD